MSPCVKCPPPRLKRGPVPPGAGRGLRVSLVARHQVRSRRPALPTLLTVVCLFLGSSLMAPWSGQAAAVDEDRPIAPPLESSVTGGESTSTWVAQRKKRRKGKRKRKGKRRGKGKRRSGAKKADVPVDKLFGPSGDGAAAASTTEPMVLDLGEVDEKDKAAAKEEILSGPKEEPKKTRGRRRVKKKDGAFDFGGGSDFSGDFDFGLDEFSLDEIELDSPERIRFDKAIALMADEEHTTAAAEFRFFIGDAAFASFLPESEYQLAKAMYKLGFLDAALKRFRLILDQGKTHPRARKSVEWLFFIARKTADQTEVLSELARFSGVKFPEAYRNEYRYLLAKYLFVQAQTFEVKRLQEEEERRNRGSKAEGFDFEAAAGVADFGGAGGFDFGGGASESGGGFDFGGGAPASAGGFDFDGGGTADRGGGGFDFSTPGTEDPATAVDAPVREAAPTNVADAVRRGLEFLKDVEKESKFGARAAYLTGLLHFIGSGGKQSAQNAVSSFQDVVRQLNPRTAKLLDPRLREQAFLSLARIHYGHQQFERSVYYYDFIDRDSEDWLTALFEASWAWFQRGDYDKALGNLLTLHSPFFEREYFPESHIVQAIIYFEACRYSETRVFIDTFLKRYSRVRKELDRIVKSKASGEEIYKQVRSELLTTVERTDDVTGRVLRLALADKEIGRAREVVGEAEAQVVLWKRMDDAFKNNQLGRELLKELNARVRRASRQAGDITRRKFESQRLALTQLLAQAYRIKIELVRAERNVAEHRLRGQTVDQVVQATPRMVVDDEHFYWPYEGEYWRDELGTYEMDFSMCQRGG